LFSFVIIIIITIIVVVTIVIVVVIMMIIIIIISHLKVDCVQVLQLCRQLSDKDRERSHLLCLYGTLCSCINSKEHRVRELVQDVLQLAGVELGLVVEPAVDSQVAS